MAREAQEAVDKAQENAEILTQEFQVISPGLIFLCMHDTKSCTSLGQLKRRITVMAWNLRIRARLPT
jgi:hypothetical protein